MFEGQREGWEIVVAYDGGDWGKIDWLDGSGRSLRLGLSFAFNGHRLAPRHIVGVMGHIGLWRTLDGQGWGTGRQLAGEVWMALAGQLGLGLGAGLGREAGEDGFDGGVHG